MDSVAVPVKSIASDDACRFDKIENHRAGIGDDFRL